MVPKYLLAIIYAAKLKMPEKENGLM